MDTESVIIWWVSPKHLTKYHQVIHVGICYFKGILSCNSRALKIVKIRVFSDNFLWPPWKRGHIVLQLSVGEYVGRSVYNQVLSAQYLLTPSLNKYQTWCRGCPQWVDVPYWFSEHRFKGQGQTTLLSLLCCRLNIFWPLHLINTKLCVGVALNA